MSSNGTRIIQFGVFEVDQRAGELRRNGARVKLQEQPFQILSLLLERPGEEVTREELQSRLWPAGTFVDFDHSLNAAVRRLRDALGPAVAAEISVPPSHPARIWWIAAAAGALLLVGLSVGLFVGKRGSQPL